MSLVDVYLCMSGVVRMLSKYIQFLWHVIHSSSVTEKSSSLRSHSSTASWIGHTKRDPFIVATVTRLSSRAICTSSTPVKYSGWCTWNSKITFVIFFDNFEIINFEDNVKKRSTSILVRSWAVLQRTVTNQTKPPYPDDLCKELK